MGVPGGGVDISADGSTVVVGAPGESYASIVNSGRAYVFVAAATGWAATGYTTTALNPKSSNSYTYFGAKVACDLTCGTIAVGAYNDYVGTAQSGAVTIYYLPTFPLYSASSSALYPTNYLSLAPANNGGVQGRFGMSIALQTTY